MEEDKLQVQRHTDLIAMLMIHEVGLRTLYRKFAGRFPVYADFWNDLSEKENEHSELLRTLKEKTSVKDSREFQKRVKNAAVKVSLEYLRREIKDVEKLQDVKEAFSIALDLENGMIEKNFFKVFSEKKGIVMQMFKRLEEETREHRALIEQERDAMEPS